MRNHLVACAVLLAGSPVAQTRQVVPLLYATIDAPGVGDVPGFMQRFRQQVLLDPAALPGLTGRSLEAITFRREGRDQRALLGGRVRLTVILSTAANAAQDASPVFAANHGADQRVVFQSDVTIPSSPALPDRNAATWSHPHAVELAFPTPFPCQSGTLCIDIEGEPIAGATTAWWPVDSCTAVGDAAVVTVGQGCAPRTSLSAGAASCMPGSTLRLIASGQRASMGVLFLSGTLLSIPLDLGLIGAPGCLLHVGTEVSVVTFFSSPIAPDMPGDASVALHAPNLPSLFGTTLYAQLANLERPEARSNPAGLVMTNAVSIRLANQPPGRPVASVRSGLVDAGQPTPATGGVRQGRAAVIQLTYR